MEPTDPKLAPFLARVVHAQTLAFASWEEHAGCALRPKSASAVSIDRPAIVEQALARACVVLKLEMTGSLEGPLLLLLSSKLVEHVLERASEPSTTTELDPEQVETFRRLSEPLCAAMARSFGEVCAELQLSEDEGGHRVDLHEPRDPKAFEDLPDEPVALTRMAVQIDDQSFATALALPLSTALAIADLPESQAA